MKDLRVLTVGIFLLLRIGFCNGQSPLFTLDNEICISETVAIQNQSTDVNQYFWDFCLDDIELGVIANSTPLTIGAILNASDLWIGQDQGNWYGFIVSNQTNELFRLDFGEDLLSTPTATNLGNPSSLLDRPGRLDIIQINNNWYGVMGYFNFGGEFILLDFGSSLENAPSASSLGNFGLNRTFSSKLVVENGDILLVVGYYDGNSIFVANYGDSFANTPSTVNHSITQLTKPRDISVEKYGEGWVVFATTELTTNVHEIVFTSLLSTPSSTEVHAITALNNPTTIDVTKEGSQFFGLVSNFSGDASIINFNDLSSSPTSSPATNLNRTSASQIVRFQGSTTLLGINTSKELRVSNYTFECLENYYSSEFEPTGRFFSSSGEFRVGLESEIVEGQQYSYEDTITVLNQTAPSISFTTDNACVSFEGAFDADTPDLSYSWNFGDGSIASGQNTSHQFASSGTYTVRLDVDDGTCSNFTEQEITIYEEPPVPDFEVVGNLCADGEIIFNNLTDDGTYAGPLSYQWDFNGQSTADTRDASFVFGSEGSKTVTLTSSIPRCENFFQTVINLQPGPTSLFSGSSVCQNDLLQFTNQSTNADSYLWDFGDGFTSTQMNASHVYTTAGNFTVQLEAFDLDGCSAIYEQEVAISPEPVADFSYDVACKGNQGVEFTDQSTVSGADILGWEWRINDQLISTEQSPTLSFDETGLVDVSLTVTSSNGCTHLYEETLNVLEDPDPAIQSDISCQSLVSTFTDNSANPETIISRVWEIEGQTYTTEQVEHTFSGSGQIDVSLTVTGQNFCSSTLYTTVSIQPAAIMDFSVSSYCDNDEILFQDLSTSSDPIVSRTWTMDGSAFFNGPTAVLEEISAGNYTIGLTAQTESGCTFQTEQIIDINEAPVASFTSSSTYGVPPFTLNLANTSSGAASYSWLINDNEVATSANTNYTISEEGNYTVELVSISENGCEDRQSLEIISRIPAINLVISDLQLTTNGNSQNVTLRVTNNGNLPIEIFDVIVSSSKDFSFSERINEYINIGEQVDVQLSSALQTSSSQRVCVKIQSAYDDINPDTSEACINFTPKVVFEDIYPNPFKDEAVVRFILPESSKVRVSVANSTGKLMIHETYNMEHGLQILRYNSSQWKKGLYFITVLYNGEMTTQRVLKF